MEIPGTIADDCHMPIRNFLATLCDLARERKPAQADQRTELLHQLRAAWVATTPAVLQCAVLDLACKRAAAEGRPAPRSFALAVQTYGTAIIREADHAQH